MPPKVKKNSEEMSCLQKTGLGLGVGIATFLMTPIVTGVTLGALGFTSTGKDKISIGHSCLLSVPTICGR